MPRESLADDFEEHRDRLRAVAYRMLGSAAEAEDAVQEAWLRLHRTDADAVDNLGGWLTTVVSRVCLDVLRSRRSHPEEPAGDRLAAGGADSGGGPEEVAVAADAVGAALLLVLDTLEPAERLAFVLHDLFGVPFGEIAPIVDRTPSAARKLASRARHRVRAAAPDSVPDVARQRRVVDAFLAASRHGDFDGLLRVLDPDVVLRADAAAVRAASVNVDRGAPLLATETRGAQSVAEAFRGRAVAVRPAVVDGLPGAVWLPRARPSAVFVFTIDGDWVTALDVIVDPKQITAFEIELVDAGS